VLIFNTRSFDKVITKTKLCNYLANTTYTVYMLCCISTWNHETTLTHRPVKGLACVAACEAAAVGALTVEVCPVTATADDRALTVEVCPVTATADDRVLMVEVCPVTATADDNAADATVTATDDEGKLFVCVDADMFSVNIDCTGATGGTTVEPTMADEPAASGATRGCCVRAAIVVTPVLNCAGRAVDDTVTAAALTRPTCAATESACCFVSLSRFT